MELTRKNYSGHFDPIWRGEAKMLPAGFKPEGDLPSGAVVLRGTPVEVNMEDLTCKIGKSAAVLDGGDTQNLRVAKSHLFVVGDEITDGSSSSSGDEGGTNANTAKITAIDSSNTDYDVLTIDSALSGSSIYVDCAPNAVVGANYENNGLGIPALDVAYEAVVLYKALSAPIVDAWKDGLHLVGNPCIKLVRQ